jgi:hypothetical protein
MTAFTVRAVAKWRGTSEWHLMVCDGDGNERALMSLPTEAAAQLIADRMNIIMAGNAPRSAIPQ